MSNITMKSVMLIDPDLPIGMIANTSAILGTSLGKLIPHQVGEDVVDACGKVHAGIITIPITMLKGEKEHIKALRTRLFEDEFSELIVVDFSDVAQSCNVYDHYIEKAANTEEIAYRYYGIAIYGDKKKINKLTGSLPLLR